MRLTEVSVERRAAIYTFVMQDMRELYDAAAARELDRRLIEGCGIAGYALMCKAAAACWRELRAAWPQARKITVLCGSGNNGGDGYEVARLARAAGCDVGVVELALRTPSGDAATARRAWLAGGGHCRSWNDVRGVAPDTEVIVDALFGTGLSRPPAGAAADAIAEINARHRAGCGVLAVDVPSGLEVDRGAAPGACVEADLSVTFIGRKFGLHTGAGVDHAGRVIYDPLVPEVSTIDRPPALAHLLDVDEVRVALPPRRRGAHKGDHGHVLIVGGDHGMAGAALMAARAALRAGAGLVTVATRAEHAAALTAAQPEVMFRGVRVADDLTALLERADAVAVGPGLGQSEWARALWVAVAGRPRLVVDADALNLLAGTPRRGESWILTPHPGEAARLLACSTREVQADRGAALRALAQRYGGYPVLKGAGSLIWLGGGVALCPYGNPGMGVGGMGDALTGIVAACLAQGLAPAVAATTGVLVHALAGDAAAARGERGLLPSDLIDQIRTVVNP